MRLHGSRDDGAADRGRARRSPSAVRNQQDFRQLDGGTFFDVEASRPGEGLTLGNTVPFAAGLDDSVHSWKSPNRIR